MRTFITAVLLCAICFAAHGQTANQNPAGKALQLVEEQERLKLLQQRLELAESKDAETRDLRARIQKGLAAQPLDKLPDSVTSEGLLVKRGIGPNGLVMTVTCTNVPTIQVMDAIALTSGLKLELHPDTGRDALLGRVSLNLKDEDMADVLQIVCGTQGLGVTLNERGIMAAPIQALATTPVEKLLREFAVQSYQAALLRYPASEDAPMAYLGLARYYASAGFEETAVETLEGLVKNYPRSETCGPALVLLGDCVATLRQMEKARNAYYRYVDNYPGAPDLPAVLMKIGATWTRQNKWDQAVPVYESVFREYSSSSEAPYARMRLAECLARQEHYDLALEQLKILEQQSRQFAEQQELRLVLAECLVKLNRMGPARVYLKQVVEQSKDVALAERACYAMGDTYLAESNPLAAVEAYRGAARDFPDGLLRETAPLRMAKACLQMGLYARAEDYLQHLNGRSVSLDEVRPTVMALAEYYLEIGDAARTLALLARLPDRDSSVDTRLISAEACLKAGNLDEALANAKAAAALSADDAAGQAAAMNLIGRCQDAASRSVLAAMAYGGKIQ